MSDEQPATVLPFDPANKRGSMQRELSHISPGVVDADTIDDLRKRRMIRDTTENVDIDPVGPGENVIGYLNEHERVLFCEILHLKADIEENEREQFARSHEMVAAAIRKTPSGKNPVRNFENTILFPTKEDAEAHYALMTQLEYLQAMYHQSIRERYGHSVVLGVRASFAVVRVRAKYEIPPEIIEQMGE